MTQSAWHIRRARHSIEVCPLFYPKDSVLVSFVDKKSGQIVNTVMDGKQILGNEQLLYQLSISRDKSVKKTLRRIGVAI